ncbi:MAG: Gfo/Idh/MocA family oxidoreductase, partial [Candidatus Nanopelagicales bacterium]
MRIGVLGVGRIGRMHADIIANETDGAEVAAVFDVNDAAAAEVADALRVPVMSIDEILESDSVDAVAICSSTDTHVELITRAAAAGKAIFCEKPISLD